MYKDILEAHQELWSISFEERLSKSTHAVYMYRGRVLFLWLDNVCLRHDGISSEQLNQVVEEISHLCGDCQLSNQPSIYWSSYVYN